MLQFSAILVTLIIIFVALRMALGKKRLTIRQFMLIYAGTLVAILLIILGVTGRLHWLFALLGAVVPLVLRIAPWVMRSIGLASLFRQVRSGHWSPFGRHQAPRAGQRSQLSTAFFHMTLDHDSGAMDGEILQGEFKGRQLSALDLPSLARLYLACEYDSDSVSVLTAFLERNHPAWRDTFAETGAAGSASAQGEDIDEATAREILGVDSAAGKEAIINAHRRLMQKFHPDRGGSTYLAAKINQAKDFLMELYK